jgi:hypothetical protein
MEPLTYHQVLADMYEENSKNMLVHSTIPEDDKDVEPEDKYPDELETQEDFQKPQPSRQTSGLLENNLEYSDKTKLSVQYEKQVKTHVINIDSRFRNYYSGTLNSKSASLVLNASTPTNNSAEFSFTLPIPINNAISVRMSSLEFPNAFYTFSKSRGNVSFYIIIPTGSTNPLNKRLINISDGNYTDVSLASAIESLINTEVSNITSDPAADPITSTIFSVLIDGGNATTASPSFVNTGKLTISSNSLLEFDLMFDNGIYGTRDNDYGLGHYIGFRDKSYYGLTSYTSESIVDTTDWPYVFLKLHGDWKVVRHQTEATNNLFAFAKINLSGEKNSLIFSNNSNTITSEFFFSQPTKVTHIPVKLVDPYDDVLDLLQMDFSLTLEIKEVLDSRLYEIMRSH